jgi:hypothetical protein
LQRSVRGAIPTTGEVTPRNQREAPQGPRRDLHIDRDVDENSNETRDSTQAARGQLLVIAVLLLIVDLVKAD